MRIRKDRNSKLQVISSLTRRLISGMECINLRAWRSVNQTSVARAALLPLFHSPSFDNHPQYGILFCLSCSSYVFPFQFQEELDLDEIAGVLQTGHSALTQQMPEVSCKAVPNVDWHQKDVFKRVKQEDESIPAIVVKDLRDFFPSNYAELSLKHFPISAFDSATIFLSGCMAIAWRGVANLACASHFHSWRNDLVVEYLVSGAAMAHHSMSGQRVWAETCRLTQCSRSL